MENTNFVELTQYTIPVPNVAGQLLKITDVLRTEGINLMSLSSYINADVAFVRFTAVSENQDRVISLMDGIGLQPLTTPVVGITIENKVGKLNDLLKFLTDNKLNVGTIIATTPVNALESLVLISVEPIHAGVVPTKQVFDKFFASQPVAA